MFKKFTLLGGLATLILGLLAADSRACFFHRRHRCLHAQTHYPCPQTSGSESAGGMRNKTRDDFIKDLEKLTGVLAKPMEPVPKMSPNVAKTLGGSFGK
jgi:hypothetical protein